MFDIIGKRSWFFLVTAVVILVCLGSLVAVGLKSGVEFSSGSVMTVDFEQEVDQAELGRELAALDYANAIIQRVGEDDFLIRLPRLESRAKTELEAGLVAGLGPLEVKEFDAVSAMVATETTRNAAIAVAVAAIGILLYVAWAFRRMSHPFRYGACAIVALLHDTLVALGTFSILGGMLGWEINLMFVTGILAVIGYSVNNTVVVFDRIRENLTKDQKSDFELVVNNSLVETMSRSLNTSLTTLFVVLALFLFIGPAIQNFAVVLLVGIVAGTYSSLFIAPSLLVVWQQGEWSRLIPGTTGPKAKAEGR
ncbi:MAG: protein translocase subunit SecF [Dehalococcoidales bacterium]|jgi:preprotein translocase subunit SecF|nr:protein translocase subunit SecF [Dehalococcoidales bacterium]MDP6501169.1 protein translocase subunit SecF [Dehalococcoidales bacterium]MDP6632367.1 protein translocase subunit SecF [Dehalococcoidales bacterium]